MELYEALSLGQSIYKSDVADIWICGDDITINQLLECAHVLSSHIYASQQENPAEPEGVCALCGEPGHVVIPTTFCKTCGSAD